MLGTSSHLPCGVLSAAEEKYARSYLRSFGYTVLDSSIPEHLGYREAMRAGRSAISVTICEICSQCCSASGSGRSFYSRPQSLGQSGSEPKLDLMLLYVTQQ